MRRCALAAVAEIHQHFFLLDPGDGRVTELRESGIAGLKRAVATQVAQVPVLMPPALAALSLSR
jgi:hypothetical protein